MTCSQSLGRTCCTRLRLSTVKARCINYNRDSKTAGRMLHVVVFCAVRENFRNTMQHCMIKSVYLISEDMFG
jgi:hypothetical protein